MSDIPKNDIKSCEEQLDIKILNDDDSINIDGIIHANMENKIALECENKLDENDLINLICKNGTPVLQMSKPMYNMIICGVYLVSLFIQRIDYLEDLKKEFFNDRISCIDNAEEEFKNALESYTSERTAVLQQCIIDVGNAIKALENNIENTIKKIYKLPKMWPATLTINVKNCTNSEKQARYELFYVVKGTDIYARIMIMLGNKTAACNRIANTIKFMQDFSTAELNRINGWRKKDDFWNDKYAEYKNQLINLLDELKKNSSN